MAKIFILGNKRFIDGELITVPIMTINDYDTIHDFVVRLYSLSDDDSKTIIDLDAVSDPALALTIAMHIRLSIEDIRHSALMPILFVSELPLQSFLHNGECSQIFLTSGIAFCSPEMVQDSIEALEGLWVEMYKSDFLNQIQIHPDEETGTHSMANQWGADVFNRIISKDDRDAKPEIKRAKKKLYYKYVYANTVNIKDVFDNADKKLYGNEPNLNIEGKKVLFIDDEADKGWKFVLRKWFDDKKNTIEVVKAKTKDFDALPEDIKLKIQSDFYDLYLLDLRMMGIAEENIYSADDFSGMKILKEIKKINKGNQVIMLTASNKAWNMKALLDEGADGYYIKESPELKLPMSFSMANFQSFKDAVEMSLNSGYKREIDRGITNLLFNIQQSTLIQNDIDFSDDLQSTLKSAQRQISSISSKEDFAFAYISLFQLLEIISRHFIVETNNGWNLPMYNYDYYGNAGNAITKTETKNPPILSKLIAIYEMNNVQAHNNHFLVKKIDDCIRRRHSFVHHLKELHIAKNKTIFAKEGIKSLWEIVNKIIKSVI